MDRFVRAAATPKAVEKFKTIVDDEMETRTDIISLNMNSCSIQRRLPRCSHGAATTYKVTAAVRLMHTRITSFLIMRAQLL